MLSIVCIRREKWGVPAVPGECTLCTAYSVRILYGKKVFYEHWQHMQFAAYLQPTLKLYCLYIPHFSLGSGTSLSMSINITLINLSPLNLERQAYLNFGENWAQWAVFLCCLENHGRLWINLEIKAESWLSWTMVALCNDQIKERWPICDPKRILNLIPLGNLSWIMFSITSEWSWKTNAANSSWNSAFHSFNPLGECVLA